MFKDNGRKIMSVIVALVMVFMVAKSVEAMRRPIRVTVPAALVFHTEHASAAAGQIHQGAWGWTTGSSVGEEPK